MSFNADSVRQLSAHSDGSKATYAYYFTENFMPAAPIWPLTPSWIKTTANHGDDLPFVFGSIYNNEKNIWSGTVTIITV